MHLISFLFKIFLFYYLIKILFRLFIFFFLASKTSKHTKTKQNKPKGNIIDAEYKEL